MRTLSKFGLAGVRLGYLMGPKAWVDEIEKVRPPYNISVLNAEAALFALEHADEFARQAALIRSERARLSAALETMGLAPFKSEANMILVRLPDAAAAFAALKRQGVLVKDVSRQHPLLANCLRLTVGTPQENDMLISALKASL
jgi:histidinol-phosphate aminotransferase